MQIYKNMKRALIVLFFVIFYSELFAQNEIGPDGNKLIWLLLIVFAIVIFIYLSGRVKIPKRSRNVWSFFQVKKVKIVLNKNKLYYPEYVTLSVKNTGNTGIDLDKPKLVFDNFWLKRNFRIKGMNNRSFYPLYLDRRKTHTLDIELTQFYSHDKRLKKYPKIRVIIYDVNNQKLGSKSIFIRKTLLKF